ISVFRPVVHTQGGNDVMRSKRYRFGAAAGVLVASGALAVILGSSASASGRNASKSTQPAVSAMDLRTGHAHAAGHKHGGGNNLSYRGGVGGIGVETAPKLYIVFWGSQWNGNDP